MGRVGRLMFAKTVGLHVTFVVYTCTLTVTMGGELYIKCSIIPDR